MANTLPSETDSSGSESGSNTDTSDLGSFLKSDSADVQRQCSRQIENATLNSTTGAREGSKLLKRGRKRKISSLSMEAVVQHVGKPISEAAETFGVSRSTLKRFCRQNGLTSWPKPKRSTKKTNHATSSKLLLEVMVKATFKRDMIMFRFPTYFGLLELKNEVAQRLHLKGKFNLKYKDKENDLLLITCDADLHNLPEFVASNTDTSVKLFVDDLTMSAVEQDMEDNRKYKFLVRGSTSKCFGRENGKHSWPMPYQSKIFNHATDPKLSQEVMVKAIFQHDMIKFRFPTSSGLLELKNEVAQRLELKGKLNIKYKDEDDDLILITCDADLHNLLEFLASDTKTSVKLHVKLVSE